MTKNFHYFKTLMSTCCIFQKVQLSMSMLTVKVKSLKSAETTSTLLTQRFSSRPNCFKTINSQIIYHLTKMSLMGRVFFDDNRKMWPRWDGSASNIPLALQLSAENWSTGTFNKYTNRLKILILDWVKINLFERQILFLLSHVSPQASS